MYERGEDVYVIVELVANIASFRNTIRDSLERIKELKE
ncbi:hypothetical protein IPA_07350 [Ignicoccus pacificus DSM 13166]|uniref:Uncharacterized protein n=1 Tax=Ignicoccus pacificus DSM 13166 TaxID=940294 RepID=A0A977KBR6_9CREN|nr:hypothetical protein IPA_07350 [Ignicoccus pacificus DSM 13166]